jgi:hypothetical protein
MPAWRPNAQQENTGSLYGWMDNSFPYRGGLDRTARALPLSVSFADGLDPSFLVPNLIIIRRAMHRHFFWTPRSARLALVHAWLSALHYPAAT